MVVTLPLIRLCSSRQGRDAAEKLPQLGSGRPEGQSLAKGCGTFAITRDMKGSGSGIRQNNTGTLSAIYWLCDLK